MLGLSSRGVADNLSAEGGTCGGTVSGVWLDFAPTSGPLLVR